MTIAITIEPESNWLEQIQNDLLNNLTTGQLADLASYVVRELGSRAIETKAYEQIARGWR